MPVIHELDEKKRDTKLQKRARRVIGELEEAGSSDDQIRPGVNCNLSPDEAVETRHMGRDDQIIEIVERSIASEDESVAIVTSDAGMRLKCKVKGITTLRLPDGDELPLPNSDDVKKMKSMEREIARMKSRVPELELCVAPEGESQDFSSLATVSMLPGIDLQKVKPGVRIRRELKPIGERPVDTTPDYGVLLGRQFPTRAQCDNYNKALNKYYDDYDNYLEDLSNWNEIQHSTIRFSLWIRNSGTQTAKDIDVKATVSKDVKLLSLAGEADDWTPELLPPDPPPKPKGQLDALRNPGNLDLPAFDQALPTLNLHSPQISEENGQKTIAYHQQVLKHGTQDEIHWFVALVPHADKVKAIKIDYHISCEEPIGPFSGSITLKIR